MFHALYRQACLEAINGYTSDASVIQAFLRNVEHAFCNRFELLTCKDGKDAKTLHLECLQELRSDIAEIRGHESCMCCRLREAAKVLTCGHAYCDICIRTFGSRSGVYFDEYVMSHCVVCSSKHGSQRFQFMPPTAGSRILTLDGGGVRGIVSLTTLCRMNQELAFLGCPLQNHFDYVAGTSSGKS